MYSEKKIFIRIYRYSQDNLTRELFLALSLARYPKTRELFNKFYRVLERTMSCECFFKLL